MSTAIYRTSPIKRIRRSRQSLNEVLVAAQGVIAGEAGQITIRHLYYRLVGLGLIEKTEAAYKGLCGHLMVWRRSGAIRYDAFADSTRYYRGVHLNDSAEEALLNAAEAYRKNLWLTQPHYVEVWCEKDAIADVLVGAVEPFGVPVFPCRGFPSASSLHTASRIFKRRQRQGKRVTLFYFGDHDPSGRQIDRTVVDKLADDHGVVVQFQRLAVTEDDIFNHNLPTRPVKGSDTRAGGWVGGCVEVDSMPMQVLRQRAAEAVEGLIDRHEWQKCQQIEQLEKQTMQSVARAMAAGREQP